MLTHKGADGGDDHQGITFSRILEQLLALGKSKGKISHGEIGDALKNLDVSAHQYEAMLESFTHASIEIVDDEIGGQ